MVHEMPTPAFVAQEMLKNAIPHWFYRDRYLDSNASAAWGHHGVIMMQRHDDLIVTYTGVLQSVCKVFHSACTVCTKVCAQEHELLT